MVNPELLISEVGKRPVLWDTSVEEYKNKIEKNAAWVAVASSLFGRLSNKTNAEQKILVQDLEKKWKSIKDNFIRCRKRNAQATRSVSGATRTKKYIYEQQLRFLDKNMEKRATNSSIMKNVEQETVDEQDNRSDTDEVKVKESITFKKPLNISKRARKIDIERRLITFMNAHQVNREVRDEDEDSAFFKSLLPTVKRLNSDQKFTFRMQTMQLLRNIEKSNAETNNSNSYVKQLSRPSSTANLFSDFSIDN